MPGGLPVEQIASISYHGRGELYLANQQNAVEIADSLIKGMKKDNPYLEKNAVLRPVNPMNQFKIYDYYFQIPLAIAILLLLFVIFFPDIKVEKLLSKEKSKIALGVLGIYFMSALSYLEAQIDESRFQAASIDYDAGDYDKSIEIYQDLLNDPLSNWQQAIVLYDLGSVYLASGQNDKALSLFNSINLGIDPQRLLLKEIRTNQAIAYLNQSQAVTGRSFDEWNKIFFYLQESLHAINSAKEADCELQKAEGSPICEPSEDLIAIEETLQFRLSRFYDQVRQFVDSLNLAQEKDPLNRLLVLYKVLLLGDLMTKASLSLLQTEQHKLDQTVYKNQKQRLEEANEWLSKSLASFAQNAKKAKFYLFKAFHELVLMQRSLEGSTQKLPITILNHIIEDQREALQLKRLIHELSKEDKTFAANQENPQKNVLATAKPFLGIVKQYQIQQFTNDKKKTPEECCQAQPWDEVIPMFDQGYRYAEQAGQGSGLSTLLDQENALSTWMQAKHVLSLPIKPHIGSCFAAKKRREEKTPSSENKSATVSAKPSFEHEARELEKMDKADSSLQPAPVQSVSVERPW